MCLTMTMTSDQEGPLPLTRESAYPLISREEMSTSQTFPE